MHLTDLFFKYVLPSGFSNCRIDERAVTDRVSPDKDVDGLGTVNQGKLAAGDMESGFMPCTPAGCMELIRRSGVEVAGAEAVVIGRSKIVGSPMAQGFESIETDCGTTMCIFAILKN